MISHSHMRLAFQAILEHPLMRTFPYRALASRVSVKHPKNSLFCGTMDDCLRLRSTEKTRWKVSGPRDFLSTISDGLRLSRPSVSATDDHHHHHYFIQVDRTTIVVIQDKEQQDQPSIFKYLKEILTVFVVRDVAESVRALE